MVSDSEAAAENIPETLLSEILFLVYAQQTFQTSAIFEGDMPCICCSG